MRRAMVLAIGLLAAAPVHADLARRRSAVVEVVQKVAPAVVFIGTEQVVEPALAGLARFEELFFGGRPARAPDGAVARARG